VSQEQKGNMMKKAVLNHSQILIALVMLVGSTLLPATARGAAALAFDPGLAFDLGLTASASPYVTAGSNITYELTLKNLSGKVITEIGVFDPLPAHTSYVSGGDFIGADNGIEFHLASLAANATHKFTLVVKVDSGVATDTVIENKDIEIYQYTIPSTKTDWYTDGASTTVEAPATVVASLKNSNNKTFDVVVDGFGFENYVNAPSRNAKDDLGADDLFMMFGPSACQSGTTAATCVPSGPAKAWAQEQINFMNGGHCDGMSGASLRFFEEKAFKGRTTPANFQSGAAHTAALSFPKQPIENYIAYYWTTQVFDEVYTQKFTSGPKEIVNKLIADFNRASPISYAVHIYKLPGWKLGHSIAAYGVEKVNNNEYRILVYDNNYPKQRQYITVNMAANTWRYVTASTPGNPPTIYDGTANSGNLQLLATNTRDLAAGQYFECPFCSSTPSSHIQAASSELIDGKISVQYSGEGAFLLVNDEGQRTGDDPETQTFLEEIPNATLIHFNGGLGKEIPPRVIVPFSETDDTFYDVIVHGKTTSSVTSGSLTILGEGFVIGVNDIALDPNEQFAFKFSPDGDHISLSATETITAPEIFISHDPVHEGDPSVIFDVRDEILFAGETIELNLDPARERIEFDDSGTEEEDFTVNMELIFPDGDTHIYTETVIVPAGATSAFIDFGAWDGLLEPATYIDNVLQNPSVNHRLKLESSTGTYDPTSQPNAPAGSYRVEATLRNVTEVTLQDLSFTVTDLADGNMLLNADGAPAGNGASVSVPAAALGEDELLHVNESFTVSFIIGLASADTDSANFTVDANGTPHDWTHEAPTLAGEANNASFVFGLENRIFLPLITH